MKKKLWIACVAVVAIALIGSVAYSIVIEKQETNALVSIDKRLAEHNTIYREHLDEMKRVDRMTYNRLPEGTYKVFSVVNEFDGTALVSISRPTGDLFYVVNDMPEGLLEKEKQFTIMRSTQATGHHGS